MAHSKAPEEGRLEDLQSPQAVAAFRARLYADSQQEIPGSCPNDEVFTAYVVHSMREEEEAAFLRHVEACPSCRLNLLQIYPVLESFRPDQVPARRFATRTKAATLFAALAASVLLFVYSPALIQKNNDAFLLLSQELSNLPKTRGSVAPWLTQSASPDALEEILQGYLFTARAGAAPQAEGASFNGAPAGSFFEVGRLVYAAEAFCRHADPMQNRHWALLRQAWEGSERQDPALAPLNREFLKKTPPACESLRSAVHGVMQMPD